MIQQERLDYLITFLLKENQKENPEYGSFVLPETTNEQKKLLRSLMNLRPPLPVSQKFLEVQDAYLTEERNGKKEITLARLSPVKKDIYLWKGDITTLRVEGIVNAGNRTLLGCFLPCHGCIDNAIHSAAGIQLRLACYEIMQQQGVEESVGTAKITEAYNLPAKYVLHTVGPVVSGAVTKKQRTQLASCYRACLALADNYRLKNIVFCCISTGEFHFPNELAAQIAVHTVTAYLEETHSEMEVVFNVFQEQDYKIYQRLLG